MYQRVQNNSFSGNFAYVPKNHPLGIKFVSKLTVDPHVEDLCKVCYGRAAAYLTQSLAEFTKDARKTV